MKRWKGLAGYLLSIGLVVVFALFLSGRVGWFLLLVFVLAPVLSVLLAWTASRRVEISGDTEADIVGKQEPCSVRIQLHNCCIFPTPPVCVQLEDSVRARSREKAFLLSMLPFAKECITAEFLPVICGPARIGIRQAVVTDYFGICSFSCKRMQEEPCQTIRIVPDISELSERDAFIYQVMKASNQVEDSEETVEQQLPSMTGYPGYAHREYTPGDPLKRVNWKLSARRDQLLVRLDEEQPGTSVCIILDRLFQIPDHLQERVPRDLLWKTQEEIVPLVEQLAVEDSLGLARFLMDLGYTVFYVARHATKTSSGRFIAARHAAKISSEHISASAQGGEPDWEVSLIHNERDLLELRMDLAGYAFERRQTAERYPYEIVHAQAGGLSVFCTPCADRGLERETAGVDAELLIHSVLDREEG